MMKKLMVGICVWGLAVSLIGQEAKPQEIKENFQYKSEGFSCTVLPSGYIKDLTLNGKVLVTSSQIFGKYELMGAEKHDARFFQADEKDLPKKAPIKIMKKEGNTYILQQKAVLSNKKHNKGVEYTENITLSPWKITFDISMKLLVPLGTKATPFASLNYLPCSTFVGKGFKVKTTNKQSSMVNFPQNPAKSTRGHIKKMMISLDDGIFTITAGEKTEFALSDTRTYGGKDYRIDVTDPLPWHKEPAELPIGKELKWSFDLTFKKHDK